jgi:hypothetical protein
MWYPFLLNLYWHIILLTCDSVAACVITMQCENYIVLDALHTSGHLLSYYFVLLLQPRLEVTRATTEVNRQ